MEGFVKPEVVAPGGHILGILSPGARLATEHPEWIYGDHFYMSGTSLWSGGYLWPDGYLWSDGYLWTDGLAESASINAWVEQE